MSPRQGLEVGSKILMSDGIGIVQDITTTGVAVKSVHGVTQVIAFTSLRPFVGGASHAAIEPWWSSLPAKARADAMLKLEIVNLVLTGYREGHEALARPNEPSWPFSDLAGTSRALRIEHAAQLLDDHTSTDPVVARRVAFGDLAAPPGSPESIKRWIRRWNKYGLRGLVDQRSLRRTPDSDRVNPDYRAVAEAIVGGLIGNDSSITNLEIDRQVRTELARRGTINVATPQRATDRFIAELAVLAGRTPRAQHSHHLRAIAGHTEIPAVRPGQYVAVDATRCNNLVYDPYDGTPRSVEILTAIDVASRVVLACRVCPMSGNSTDLRYLLYDVLREFHTYADGTSITDWRWAGLPEAIDLTDAHTRIEGPGRGRYVIKGSPLTGVHINPSVWPDGFRVDRGSINLSNQTRRVLADLGIDLLPNRGGKSNDNAHIERWWSTLDRGLQGIPGYKGRNASERGSTIAKSPLMTWQELETYLHWWIATDYHRVEHSSLHLPDDVAGPAISPLEMFDALRASSGRMDVLQHPDLLYQLLDVVWLTPGHAGVEHRNLTYSADILKDIGPSYTGNRRDGDRAVPFFVDPHDLAQIWYQDDNGDVHEIPWRGRDRTHAPMTAKVINRARSTIQQRNGRPDRKAVDQEILAYLMKLETSAKASDRRQMFAAAVRVSASRTAHAEAMIARNQVPNETPTQHTIEPARHTHIAEPDVWEDYIDLDHGVTL